MTDEPDGGDGTPKFMNNLKGWIGGATGVVIALAGLGAAIHQLTGGSDKKADAAQTENVSSEAADTETLHDEEANAAAEAAPALAESYSGEKVTLVLSGRDWVYNQGEQDEATYEQKGGREDGYTYATNYNRDYELRWPNDGGALEEKTSDADWTVIDNVTADEPAEE